MTFPSSALKAFDGSGGGAASDWRGPVTALPAPDEGLPIGCIGTAVCPPASEEKAKMAEEAEKNGWEAVGTWRVRHLLYQTTTAATTSATPPAALPTITLSEGTPELVCPLPRAGMHVAFGPMYVVRAAFCAVLCGAHVSLLLLRTRYSSCVRVSKTPAGSDVSLLQSRRRYFSCVRGSKTPAGSDASWLLYRDRDVSCVRVSKTPAGSDASWRHCRQASLTPSRSSSICIWTATS